MMAYGSQLSKSIFKFKSSWAGLLDYEAGLALQTKIVEGVRGKEMTPTIISCEHKTVITLGKRGQPVDDILASMAELREKNIEIVSTDRGGQATLHNPGQLVIYPILPLREWHLGVRQYVECLERATAFLLAEFGVEVTRSYEPGLWVGGAKIAAFGIRVDRGVSLHGLAINISNNLSDFSLIRQCGKTTLPTSLRAEMLSFMSEDSLPVFNLSELSQKWALLFEQELASAT